MWNWQSKEGMRTLMLRMNCKRYLANVPKFDDAEILATRLNQGNFKSSRRYDTSKGSNEINNEYRSVQYQRLRKLKYWGGAFLISSLGISAFYYVNTSNLFKHDQVPLNNNITTVRKRKYPQVSPDELSFDIPGLYLFGGQNPNRRWLGIPKRVSLFDNMKLRDVCITDNEIYYLDQRGDLYKESNNEVHPVLRDQDLKHIKISNGSIYALNAMGEILIVPKLDYSKYTNRKRSWLLPWKLYEGYSFKLNTHNVFNKKLGENKVIQFDTGESHLLLISNLGKVYSCATTPSQDLKGAIGIPNFSNTDGVSEPNKLQEVELLNSYIKKGKNDKQFIQRQFTKIACGNNHSLALDSTGELFTFGWNRYGQLCLPIDYENEIVSYPKQISTYKFRAFYDIEPGTEFRLHVTDINCGSDTSYVGVTNQDGESKLFSFGSGSLGELANGTFKGSQPEPTTIKLSSDEINKIGIKKIVTDSTSHHLFILLNDGTLKASGSNQSGQLGNWKNYKLNKPTVIPEIISQDHIEEESTLNLHQCQNIAVGKNSTCIYWN